MNKYHIKVLYGGTYQIYLIEANDVVFDDSFIFFYDVHDELISVFP